jgi:hypothetical protein
MPVNKAWTIRHGAGEVLAFICLASLHLVRNGRTAAQKAEQYN